MARIRTIKPDFFTSEDIVALSPYARLFYIALWCEADREGRFSWKPTTFKLRYFPGDAVDVQALGKELIDRGLVVLYGAGLAYIPTFLDHQHVNPRETPSSLPTPDASPRVDHASGRDSDAQGGREGKGKEIPCASRNDGLNGSFTKFWIAYPRKKSKGAAEKAWLKIKPDEQLSGAILAAVERAKTSADWQREGGQFIPHPATWLNAKGWEDESSVSLTARTEVDL